MINKQHNTRIVLELNVLNNKIKDIMRSETKGEFTDKDYSKVARNTMLRKDLDELASLLKDRFGFGVSVNNLRMKDSKLSSIIMPNLNYKTANIALNRLDDLFPKKKLGDTLWHTMATNSEVAIYDTLAEVRTSIQQETLKINFDRAYVYGLDKANFIINLDLLTMFYFNTSPEEMTSLLLHEVGRIFAYIEYITNTTNNTFTLLDTFINSRFENDDNPIKSLSIAMKKVDKKHHSDSITLLEELEPFMLNTFNIDPVKKNIKIEYDRSADIFVTRFGLGTEMANILAKRASDGTISMKEDEGPFDNSFLNNAIDMILVTITAIIMLLLFVIGFLFMLVFVVVKIIGFIIKFIFKTIASVLSILFRTSSSDDKLFEIATNRISRIKIELIRNLRTTTVNKEDRKYLTNQIDEISTLLDMMKENIASLNKYGYIPNLSEEDNINDILESLQENELHYFGAKFDLLK